MHIYKYKILGCNFHINYPLGVPQQKYRPDHGTTLLLKVKVSQSWKSESLKIKNKIKLEKSGYITFNKNIYTVTLDARFSKNEIQCRLLHQAVPMILASQGEWILHACGIRFCHQTLLFTGRSGSGKSTMAHQFASSGAKFFGDESLRITLKNNALMIHASSPEVRLINPDFKYKSKQAFGKSRILMTRYFKRRPEKLSHIVSLHKCRATSKIRLKKLDINLALKVLLTNTYNPDYKSRKIHKHYWPLLSNALIHTNIWQMHLPHRKNIFEKVKNLLQKKIIDPHE